MALVNEYASLVDASEGRDSSGNGVVAVVTHDSRGNAPAVGIRFRKTGQKWDW